MAIVRKAFKNLDNRLSTPNSSLRVNKLALKVFNWELHDQKISKSLVVSFFFSLPDYYSLIIVVKIINILLLKIVFDLILGSQDLN